jgi:hypothetical protein
VCFDVASTYGLIKTSTLNQAGLLRAEGAVAFIAALLLVVRPRRYTVAVAAPPRRLGAAGGAGLPLQRHRPTRSHPVDV